MTRLDWLILRRVGGRICLTVLVFFGLIALVESLDTWRFQTLSAIGGPPLAILAIASAAARWTIRTLSVTVLVGSLIGILDLQARREMVVIKSAGLSIWRIVKVPVLWLAVASLFVTIGIETGTTLVNRNFNPSTPSSGTITENSEMWLEQSSGDSRYVLHAKQVQPGGLVVYGVTIFPLAPEIGSRITAERAELKPGEWLLTNATRIFPDRPDERFDTLGMPTTSTPTDIQLRVASTEDLTFFELAQALTTEVSDPRLHATVATRFLRMLTLPLLLVGSLLIAFAFTAGYRRSNNYGAAILYGIILGFVVFVIAEMAERAGASGALDPTLAVLGPAFVAIVIGTTVLLYREDGRA